MMEEPKYAWTQAYVTAILETDNAKMHERIHTADTRVRARLSELSMDHSGTPEEREALDSAIRGLNALRQERIGDTSGGSL